MAELSAKKVKKEKRQNREVAESTPSKLKKDRSEVSKENTVQNGSAQKKKKTTLDESTTEKVEKGPGSKIRSTKLRMMVRKYTLISSYFSLKTMFPHSALDKIFIVVLSKTRYQKRCYQIKS